MNRPYRQSARAEAAAEKTERIMEAALELFLERPFDQLTLAAVAERAGVGLQTLIRRVETKDGLARAVNAWIVPKIEAARALPDRPDPRAVAAALATHYEAYGTLTDRMLRQEDVSPALAEAAAGGRAAHAAWIESAFAEPLARAEHPARLRAQLIGLCGVELWLVLRRELSADETQAAVAEMIALTLEP